MSLAGQSVWITQAESLEAREEAQLLGCSLMNALACACLASVLCAPVLLTKKCNLRPTAFLFHQ